MKTNVKLTLTETEARDRQLFSNCLQLVRLDDNEAHRAWVEGMFATEDEYMEQLLGKRKLQSFKAAARRLQREISIWAPVVNKDEMSEGMKGWLETKAHGIVDTAVRHVLTEDGKTREIYDGDMEYDSTKSLGEQLARTYVIPYLRESMSYSIVGWDNDRKSFCKKEIHRGDIVNQFGKKGQKYPMLRVYLAKKLPSENHVLVQEKLQQWAQEGKWDHFNLVRMLFSEYKKSMFDRSPQIKTMKNGRNYVYYLEFRQAVLYSPIIWAELSDRAQAEIQEKTRVWKQYQANIGRIEEQQVELLKIKQAVETGLLVGDDVAFGCFISTLMQLVKDIKIHAPWRYKDLLKPFYSYIYQKDLDKVDLFSDEAITEVATEDNAVPDSVYNVSDEDLAR